MHVFEVLNVSTLVTGHSDCLSIFLNGGVHDFFHTAVMTQVNYFNSGRLNNPAHDVDGSIMAIEKTGCCNNSNFIFGLVWSRCLVTGQVGLVRFFCCSLGAHELELNLKNTDKKKIKLTGGRCFDWSGKS